jgi:hypothetical protein
VDMGGERGARVMLGRSTWTAEAEGSETEVQTPLLEQEILSGQSCSPPGQLARTMRKRVAEEVWPLESVTVKLIE